MRPAFKRLAVGLAWGLVALVIAFLYAPLVPPAIKSFATAPGSSPFAHYAAILTDQRLMAAARLSLLVGVLVALIAPFLALLAAEAVRVWRIPRLVIAVILIPLFVPGISMGLATALFFQMLGVAPSLLTITAVQVIWALPFAFLIVLTGLANFDPVLREAAHMSGANRLQAFFEIELPQIQHAILGAAVFSLILSFNETIRTSVVQGGRNTVQTYLWAQYQQVGLLPNLYALMTILIVATLVLLALLAILGARERPT
jgi:ABC-type spermidine/putrescine transport system permease subunit II